jgi:hypothetical protein
VYKSEGWGWESSFRVGGGQLGKEPGRNTEVGGDGTPSRRRTGTESSIAFGGGHTVDRRRGHTTDLEEQEQGKGNVARRARKGKHGGVFLPSSVVVARGSCVLGWLENCGSSHQSIDRSPPSSSDRREALAQSPPGELGGNSGLRACLREPEHTNRHRRRRRKIGNSRNRHRRALRCWGTLGHTRGQRDRPGVAGRWEHHI